MPAKPLFSIIMPVFLGKYRDAATNRKEKFERAVASVLQQENPDWELIIVSDGCKESYEYKFNDTRIRQFYIEKQKHLSGVVRNEGLKHSEGEYDLYLDSDDYWGKKHLSIIDKGLYKNQYPDWAYFNDWIGQKDGKFVERICNINQRHQCGTSNIVHRSGLLLQWTDGYLHDWQFIARLKHLQGLKIATPEYLVCHLPKILDI